LLLLGTLALAIEVVPLLDWGLEDEAGAEELKLLDVMDDEGSVGMLTEPGERVACVTHLDEAPAG
jgi:hypothetical protein